MGLRVLDIDTRQHSILPDSRFATTSLIFTFNSLQDTSMDAQVLLTRNSLPIAAMIDQEILGKERERKRQKFPRALP